MQPRLTYGTNHDLGAMEYASGPYHLFLFLGSVLTEGCHLPLPPTLSSERVVESTTFHTGRGGSIPGREPVVVPLLTPVVVCSFFCDSAPPSVAPARAILAGG